MNQENNNDRQVQLQEPVPGQDVRPRPEGIHTGAEEPRDLHSLRLVEPSSSDGAIRTQVQDEEGLIPGFVFVFGSNLAGIHGAGAANTAYRHRNFPWGCGEGLAKMCYALPTKDIHIQTLPLHVITKQVRIFLSYAEEIHTADSAWGADPDTIAYGHTQFQVTRVGCGLAGLTNAIVAPMFASASPNCWFDEKWRPWLGNDRRYWGTF